MPCQFFHKVVLSINGRLNVRECGFDGHYCPRCIQQQEYDRVLEAARKEAVDKALKVRQELDLQEAWVTNEYRNRMKGKPYERLEFLRSSGWERTSMDKVKVKDSSGSLVEMLEIHWKAPKAILDMFYPADTKEILLLQTNALKVQIRYNYIKTRQSAEEKEIENG